ncbi:MAG: DUF4321 domain-containing protein [Oscillospiraceae bacterium]
MKFKRNLAFVFFIVAGVVVGALLASAAEGSPYLGWLSYGKWVGLPVHTPLVIDLALVRVALGFEIGINVAQIFTITLSLMLYKRIAQKL